MYKYEKLFTLKILIMLTLLSLHENNHFKKDESDDIGQDFILLS